MENPKGSDGQESPQAFAFRLGLPFTNTLLLSRALTHRSYLNEHPEALEDNERLEFLGDAVLDYLVANWLYHRFPEMAEGEMTRMRSALVGTRQLAEFGRLIGVNKAMRLGRGEEEAGGRQRSVLLCATFEAVIGAMSIDLGMEAVMEFVEPLLTEAADLIIEKRRDKDPKSLLQEWAQAQGYGVPLYRSIEIKGPDHAREFVFEVLINGKIKGQGSGPSKQSASKEAARNALIALGFD